MGYSVPSKSDATDAGKTGAVDGGALAIGEVMGRAVLGRGAGTAVGGLASAAAQTNETTRNVQAILAVERAANELTQGSGA